ncbi:radical SAM family heme chaperone HemW [Frigidibacter sp. ROC022]|uniref:radical SAM family heme chaperone HemW n=1 Tax=Frigidibacter sp. ROC022 TaxID=2971796 RepID=UPI00215B1C8E|nr:radical SAM family heme chaperone HemW [Frigidibacter sp. ROC022]MCR8724466.1 radical SAM family heme chaperone HemW [Frigidibacter sp. ROC022]
MPADRVEAGFGLYVHWPYCLSKCPYCDFNSHVAAQIDQQAFVQAYQAEIESVARLTGPRRLDSIFFGGGTPSLMAPATVEAVLAAAREAWSFANDIEITLEANPTSVEAAAFDGFRLAGVNRISVGLQALNDDDLRALGRLHSVDEALRALEIAQARFDRVSCDLIYARQGQTPEAWEAELTRALALGTDHLSLYQLTIEDGTAFGDRHRRGLLRGLPDEDRSVALFEITQTMTAAAGLPAYEVSNHARPGQECRHNLIYWRGGDWAGIGPGAHGRLTLDERLATETPRAPKDWLAAVADSRSQQIEALTPDGRAAEYLMMSLRLTEGSDLSRFRALGGEPIEARMADLVADGFLRRDGERLFATASGRLLLNSVLRALLA